MENSTTPKVERYGRTLNWEQALAYSSLRWWVKARSDALADSLEVRMVGEARRKDVRNVAQDFAERLVEVDVHPAFDGKDSQECFGGILKDRCRQTVGMWPWALYGSVSLLE